MTNLPAMGIAILALGVALLPHRATPNATLDMNLQGSDQASLDTKIRAFLAPSSSTKEFGSLTALDEIKGSSMSDLAELLPMLKSKTAKNGNQLPKLSIITNQYSSVSTAGNFNRYHRFIMICRAYYGSRPSTNTLRMECIEAKESIERG
ncbi:uncharacterized protein EURHEDRAFT_534642 [Aspergillus ruber CBS 135680]|uniref:Uncharacterized protein n=1 Tax=Aspergillus ruber (strain CBS 135680) TaxID=1388766 RepID=A0A017SQU6_ASPRC|nr:uncharacterized protein EURHEDRAFT_534642 [Aspergillus ruber CBS 135680]EYE99347.1 hypothetical protein EURHEDRAFT_534642 [Aspergillus ruber CBS 135680]